MSTSTASSPGPSDPGASDPGAQTPSVPADQPRVVSASAVVDAPADAIFELIADPARQVEWDGNDNLGEAAAGQRVHQVGDVFEMVLTTGAVRENRIVEFEEGRRIAWLPSPQGEQPPGHLWHWDLAPDASGGTLVTHTYDWSGLTDAKRLPKARATSAAKLQASVDRLARLAESEHRGR